METVNRVTEGRKSDFTVEKGEIKIQVESNIHYTISPSHGKTCRASTVLQKIGKKIIVHALTIKEF